MDARTAVPREELRGARSRRRDPAASYKTIESSTLWTPYALPGVPLHLGCVYFGQKQAQIH